MPTYVLDSGAILCTLFNEEGANIVTDLLLRAQSGGEEDGAEVLVPFIALMETEYVLRRRVRSSDAERALLRVENWPILIRESSAAWRHEAARLKALGGVSLADAWIAALALMEGAEVVHRDPELDRVPGLKSLRLPDRSRRA